jgi:hypothetical protein
VPQVITTVQFPLGMIEYPQTVRANPGTGYVYISGAGVVAVSGTQVIAHVAEGGGWSALDVNPRTGYVYADSGDSHVAVISGTTVVTRLLEKFYAYAIAVNSTSGYVYVANGGDKSPTAKTAILSGTQVVTILPVSGRFFGVNPQSGYVYLTGYGTNYIHVISATQVVTTLSVTDPTAAIDVNPRTGLIYVAHYSGKITVFSGTQVVASLALGYPAYRVVVNPTTLTTVWSRC